VSIILAASPALAVGELPTVNPAKIVSALDLYGIPKSTAPAAATRAADSGRIAAPSKKQAARAEYLIPNKPSGDLWSNNLYGEPPLRMPDESEAIWVRGYNTPLETGASCIVI
jgi:hypothetical protein